MSKTEWNPKLPQGFPLSKTSRGYIARINGRPRWICGKKTPEQALAIYHRKAAALTSGRIPLPQPLPANAKPTLHWLLNKWLSQKLADAEGGTLKHRTWVQYRRSCKRIDREGGQQFVDEISPDWTQEVYNRIRTADGADAARRAISHLQMACRHAEDMKWVSRVSLGTGLVRKLGAKPKATMKWMLYKPWEIRHILAASLRGIRAADGRGLSSKVQMHAMILLALNGGYGPKELSDLPRAVIDLDNALIDFDRVKTGSNHITPLWGETVAAIREVMKHQTKSDRLFLTREGNPWTRAEPFREGKKIDVRHIDNVNERFRELVEPIGLRIAGQGFYKLKHLHCTTADNAGDPHATFALAGHKLPGSKSHYVKIDPERVRKVVEYVRHCLLKTRRSKVSQPDSRKPDRPSRRSQCRPKPSAGSSKPPTG